MQKRRDWSFVALIAVAMGVACGDAIATAPQDAPAPSPSTRRLSPHFVITSDIVGSSQARNITCGLDLAFDLTSDAVIDGSAVRYTFRGGGGLYRTSVDATDRGIGLYADAAMPDTKIEIASNDSLHITTIDPSMADKEGFWKGVSRFDGLVNADGSADGTWTCLPFMIWENGWVDTVGVIAGDWHLRAK